MKGVPAALVSLLSMLRVDFREPIVSLDPRRAGKRMEEAEGDEADPVDGEREGVGPCWLGRNDWFPTGEEAERFC